MCDGLNYVVIELDKYDALNERITELNMMLETAEHKIQNIQKIILSACVVDEEGVQLNNSQVNAIIGEYHESL